MIALAIFCSLFQPAPIQESKITLFRGAEIGQEFRYWGVRDTFLDREKPEENFGRDFLLSGGPGKPIILHFGNLQGVVPPDQRIKSARIELFQEIGKGAELASISELRVRWSEGPGRRGAMKELGGDPSKVKDSFASTYNARFAAKRGAIGWAEKGASGLRENRPIPEAKLVQEKDVVAITGITEALNRALERPYDHQGFKILFATPCDFASSDALLGRPSLILELEPAAKRRVVSTPEIRFIQGKWTPPAGAEWQVDGVATDNPPAPQSGGDGRVHWVRAETASGIYEVPANATEIAVDIPNNGLEMLDKEAQVRGFATYRDWCYDAVRVWNEIIIPQSRYSFAMDGAPVRFRVASFEPVARITHPFSLRDFIRRASVKAGVPDFGASDTGAPIAPFPGITGGGDTRDESMLIGQIPLPVEPFGSELIDSLGLESSDLYSMAEVASLASSAQMPKLIFVKLKTPFGVDVPGGSMIASTLDGTAQETVTITHEGRALVPLAKFSQAKHPVIRLDITSGELRGTAFLRSASILEAVARSQSTSGVVEVVAPMSGIPVDENTNLALGRFVTDSGNSAPAIQASLVDNKDDSGMPFPAGKSWIEVDMGRDRLYGAVDITMSATTEWDRLTLTARETGQDIGAAQPTLMLGSSKWLKLAYGVRNGDAITLRLYPEPTQARYLRIELQSSAAGRINELRVRAAKPKT